MIDEHGRAMRPALVFFALAMGGFAIGTAEFASMSLLPYFSQGLGVDEPTAGHVISAYALGVVVGAPLLAIAAARLSRRTLLLLLMTFVLRVSSVRISLSTSSRPNARLCCRGALALLAPPEG